MARQRAASVTLRALTFEGLWPWGATVLIVVVWWWIGAPFPAAPDGLFGAAATVSSIFASFLGVSKAIILTIKGTPIFAYLKEKGHTETLFSYLRSGIFASVFFAAMSIIGFFVSHTALVEGHRVFGVFSVLWIAAGALALFTYVRISHILFKLLKVA